MEDEYGDEYESVVYDEDHRPRHEFVQIARAFAAFSLPAQQTSTDKAMFWNRPDLAWPDHLGRVWIREVAGFRSRKTSRLMIAPGATGLPHGTFGILNEIMLTELANNQGRIITIPTARDAIAHLKGCSLATAGSGKYTSGFLAAQRQMLDATWCYMPPEPEAIAGRKAYADHQEKVEAIQVARYDFTRRWRDACIKGLPLPEAEPHHGIFVFKLCIGQEKGCHILSEPAYQMLTGGELANGGHRWLMGHPVKLRLSSVRELSGNHTALTLYSFANARKLGIKKRLELSLYALWTQIGGMHPSKSFYSAVKRNIASVEKVWPACGLFYNAGRQSYNPDKQRAPKLVILEGLPQEYWTIRELEIDRAIVERRNRLRVEQAILCGVSRWEAECIASRDPEAARLDAVIERKREAAMRVMNRRNDFAAQTDPMDDIPFEV
jgi:hypothetical protein